MEDTRETAENAEWWRPEMGAAIDALRDGGTMIEAAHAAGVERKALWAWRRQHPEFEALCRQAWIDGADTLEQILDYCANKAKEDPRYQPSLHRSLQARRRADYADRVGIEHSGPGGEALQFQILRPEKVATDGQ